MVTNKRIILPSLQGKKGKRVIAHEDGLTLLGIQREVIALTEGS